MTRNAWRALDDAWELRDLNGMPEWAPIALSGVGPGPRWYHSGAWDAASSRLIMVGGRDASDKYDMNVWILALETANQPPFANAGADQYVNANENCDALVPLDGRRSADPDGHSLSYTWSGPFGTATGPTPTVSLPQGRHEVTLTVSDGQATDSDTVTIVVADVLPPQIEEIAATPNVIWPPNHKMVPVSVTMSVSDTCSPGQTSCRIIDVHSSEAGGENEPDWQVTGDLAVELRAERTGQGEGRIYTVVVACQDPSGNAVTQVLEVKVDHDRRR